MKKRALVWVGILLFVVFLILMFTYGPVIVEKLIYTGRIITGWDAYGCTPSCSGKECGDDGCGGSCGDCSAGQNCSSGQCVDSCTPSCSGKECGDDGCGGSCGNCSAGQSCSSGQCVDGDCTPSCAGKVCGSDGCEGSCGNCSAGQSCSSGQCIPEGTEKQCEDGVDNDGDGLIDIADPGCWTDRKYANTYNKSLDDESVATAQCQDGIDNDGDGKIDVDDLGCYYDRDGDGEYLYEPTNNNEEDSDENPKIVTEEMKDAGKTLLKDEAEEVAEKTTQKSPINLSVAGLRPFIWLLLIILLLGILSLLWLYLKLRNSPGKLSKGRKTIRKKRK